MRVLVFLLIALLITLPFISIESFTVLAWLSLSVILGLAYESYYVSQENNYKLNSALLDRLRSIENKCTELSVSVDELTEYRKTKKKFNVRYFKKDKK